MAPNERARRHHPTVVRWGLIALTLLAINSSSEAHATERTATVALALSDAYRFALEHSTDLRIARERVMQATIDLDRAWALLKPNWNLSYTFTHIEPAPAKFPSFPNLTGPAVQMACGKNATDFTACIQALQDEISNPSGPALDFVRADTHQLNSRVTWNVLNGRALPTIANAEDTIELEKLRFGDDKQRLLLQIARVYYGSVATHKARETAARAKERAMKQLQVTRTRREAGDDTKVRVLGMEIAARQADLDLRRAHNADRQAQIALGLAIGIDPPLSVSDPPEPISPSDDEDGLIKTAIDQRSDLAAARVAITIAERTREDAWWKFAPVLSLFGAFHTSNVAGLSGQRAGWDFGLAASMLLYDGGLRYSDLDEADSRIRVANLTTEALIRATRAEIRRARLEIETATLERDRADDTVRLAEERAELVRTQYGVGAARDLDLREALDAVSDAELARIRARHDRALAILQLLTAIGSLEP